MPPAPLPTAAPLHAPAASGGGCEAARSEVAPPRAGPRTARLRTQAARLLRRRPDQFFGGGSVAAVLAAPAARFSPPKPSAAEAFADGTPHFAGVAALPRGFDALARVGGAAAIAAHAGVLARELVARLRDLRHANGRGAVVLHGAWAHGEAAARAQGPTVAFSVLRADGSHVGYAEAEKLAALHRPPIQLRTGCCCNPGGCQRALRLSDADVRALFAAGKRCGDDLDLVDGRPTGVVRVSLGKDSIWEDVDELVRFLELHFVNSSASAAASPWPASAAATPVAQHGVAPTLAAIYLYPIKSCGAMRTARWPAERATGRLLHDREWALVDAHGAAMRLSAHPRMALLAPAVDLQRRTLLVRAQGRRPLSLPLDDGCEAAGRGLSGLQVCGADCCGRDCGDAAASWFSEVLGVQCRLVRFHAPGHARAASVAFANESPLLLLSQASVDALNGALARSGEPPVDARHFRPNLVVSGGAAAGGAAPINPEDRWSAVDLAAGQLKLAISGPCARCAMVEVDPSSGARHGAVLRALAQYRRDRTRIHFGVFCGPGEVASNGQRMVELAEGSAVEFSVREN